MEREKEEMEWWVGGWGAANVLSINPLEKKWQSEHTIRTAGFTLRNRFNKILRRHVELTIIFDGGELDKSPFSLRQSGFGGVAQTRSGGGFLATTTTTTEISISDQQIRISRNKHIIERNDR